jgi:hypothetical protein
MIGIQQDPCNSDLVIGVYEPSRAQEVVCTFTGCGRQSLTEGLLTQKIVHNVLGQLILVGRQTLFPTETTETLRTVTDLIPVSHTDICGTVTGAEETCSTADLDLQYISILALQEVQRVKVIQGKQFPYVEQYRADFFRRRE